MVREVSETIFENSIECFEMTTAWWLGAFARFGVKYPQPLAQCYQPPKDNIHTATANQPQTTTTKTQPPTNHKKPLDKVFTSDYIYLV